VASHLLIYHPVCAQFWKLMRAATPPLEADHYPQLVGWTPGVTIICGEAYSPPWERRGECAQIKRSREATFEGHRRGGWFNYRLSDVEPTTPAAPKQSVASHFIVRRGDPSLAKEGNTPLVTFSNNDRCPAAELWDTIRFLCGGLGCFDQEE